VISDIKALPVATVSRPLYAASVPSQHFGQYEKCPKLATGSSKTGEAHDPAHLQFRIKKLQAIC
jgi:hypothetical protein